MTKKIIYVMPDRVTPDHFGHSHAIPPNVAVGSPSTIVVEAMMGDGGIIRADQVSAQAAIWAATGVPLEDATKFCQGIATGGLTEDEAIARIGAKDKPERTLAIHIVDSSLLPSDHVCDGDMECSLYDAWEWVDGAVVVNMPKARVLHMDAIREARIKELAAKDIEFMRAVEAGDTDAQTTIGAAKQALRDLPTTFDLTTGVTTPTQLKSKWPDILPTRE